MPSVRNPEHNVRQPVSLVSTFPASWKAFLRVGPAECLTNRCIDAQSTRTTIENQMSTAFVPD